MNELLAGAAGQQMSLVDYLADFDRHFWRMDSLGFWKLERQQFFREPGYDTWEAFNRGDWDESLRLLDAGRAELAAEHRRIAAHGLPVRRVRVVEEPLTAYLQWELQVLRVREQYGTGIRIVRPEQVAPWEPSGPVPEICTLGSAVLYEAVYDPDGVLESAIRYDDPALVQRCQRLIAHLYAEGEPLRGYFARRVAPLSAPVGHRSG